MKETPEAIRFLQGFAQEMQAVESGTSYYGDRLERALLYCKQCISPIAPEAMVISRSIAQIVEEMNEYLQYYEEEIEKGFEGANTMEEWDRIHGTVIRPFLDTLGSESNIDSHEKRMSLIGTLIVDWNNFERERAQTLSEQAIR